MSTLLSKKVKNAVEKRIPGMEYVLKNKVINGIKKGCYGFIRNPKNDSIVYVDTEEPCLSNLHFMYRYADHMSDYRGYHNRWADDLDSLADGIANMLKTHVSKTNDFRI